MTTPTTLKPPRNQEPIETLRAYRELAPWNVRDFAALASAFLDAAGVRPTSAVAADHPSPRTIRFYVAQGILSSPTGRGPTATYSYQHLLELLAVKLRQVEGEPLKNIATEIPRDAFKLEREISESIGTAIPALGSLQIPQPESARGKAAKVFHAWHALSPSDEAGEMSRGLALTKWHRIPVARGLELHVHEGHPLAALTAQSEAISAAVKHALASLLRNSYDQERSTRQDSSIQ